QQPGKLPTITVTGQSTVTALRQATSAIPIVLAIATDPIGTGTIASLARPGGNVTGLSLQAPDLAGKRLELLREVVSGLHRLAIQPLLLARQRPQCDHGAIAIAATMTSPTRTAAATRYIYKPSKR